MESDYSEIVTEGFLINSPHLESKERLASELCQVMSLSLGKTWIFLNLKFENVHFKINVSGSKFRNRRLGIKIWKLLFEN